LTAERLRRVVDVARRPRLAERKLWGEQIEGLLLSPALGGERLEALKILAAEADADGGRAVGGARDAARVEPQGIGEIAHRVGREALAQEGVVLRPEAEVLVDGARNLLARRRRVRQAHRDDGLRRTRPDARLRRVNTARIDAI
jgi:hypothetical protein